MKRNALTYLCLLAPFLALPFFILVGTSHGFSMERVPPPGEPHNTYVALLTTLYPAVWLVYLFACVKWRMRWAARAYMAVWLSTSIICIQTLLTGMLWNPATPDWLRPVLMPCAVLHLPFVGYSTKPVWNGVVHIVMLAAGLFALFLLRRAAKNPGSE